MYFKKGHVIYAHIFQLRLRQINVYERNRVQNTKTPVFPVAAPYVYVALSVPMALKCSFHGKRRGRRKGLKKWLPTFFNIEDAFSSPSVSNNDVKSLVHTYLRQNARWIEIMSSVRGNAQMSVGTVES